jgi:hypothetical protein
MAGQRGRTFVIWNGVINLSPLKDRVFPRRGFVDGKVGAQMPQVWQRNGTSPSTRVECVSHPAFPEQPTFFVPNFDRPIAKPTATFWIAARGGARNVTDSAAGRSPLPPIDAQRDWTVFADQTTRNAGGPLGAGLRETALGMSAFVGCDA